MAGRLEKLNLNLKGRDYRHSLLEILKETAVLLRRMLEANEFKVEAEALLHRRSGIR